MFNSNCTKTAAVVVVVAVVDVLLAVVVMVPKVTLSPRSFLSNNCNKLLEIVEKIIAKVFFNTKDCQLTLCSLLMTERKGIRLLCHYDIAKAEYIHNI